jgi:hypothetical protein
MKAGVQVLSSRAKLLGFAATNVGKEILLSAFINSMTPKDCTVPPSVSTHSVTKPVLVGRSFCN